MPDFAARWDATLDAGIAGLEARLLELACDGSGALAPDGPTELVSLEEGLWMLNLYRKRQAGTLRRGGVYAKPAPIEDVARHLIARLKRMGVRLPDGADDAPGT